MTLELDGDGTKQKIEVKTHGIEDLKNIVFFGKYEISLDDFLESVSYVLTNTDLESNDPRLEFVRRVMSMKVMPGYNEKGKRLKFMIYPKS